MGFSSPSVRVKRRLITWSGKVLASSGELDGRIQKRYAKDAHRHRHEIGSLDTPDNVVQFKGQFCVHTPFIILKDLAHSCSKCVHANVISLPGLTRYRVVHRLNEICKLHLTIKGKARPTSLECNLNSSFAEICRERVPKIFGASVTLC